MNSFTYYFNPLSLSLQSLQSLPFDSYFANPIAIDAPSTKAPGAAKRSRKNKAPKYLPIIMESSTLEYKRNNTRSSKNKNKNKNKNKKH